MGEIADMILEGILCEGCGCALQGEAQGFPRRCKDCQRLDRLNTPTVKVPCPICKKLVKPTGLKDHMRDVHPPLTQQEWMDEFIKRAGFLSGWPNLESWARRMVEQAYKERKDA